MYNIVQYNEVILGRAQYMVLEINGMHCGFLNVYAPNQLGEMVTFWTWLSSELLDIENWLLGGDFNMIEMVSDRCGGGNTILRCTDMNWHVGKDYALS